MERKYRVVALGPMLFTLLFLMACSSQQGSQDLAVSASERGARGPAPAKERQTLYTAYNLWCEKPAGRYCINYCKGRVIPGGGVPGGVSARAPNAARARMLRRSADAVGVMILVSVVPWR